MKFSQWLIQEECPLRDYGGIPNGGGYKANTEYEVAAQLIAEAAHCILGSLGKIKAVQAAGETAYNPMGMEEGHIFEELRIIQKSIKEYAQDLYTGRVFKPDKYGKDSIKSMKSNSPKLQGLARKKINELEGNENQYDPRVFNMAYQSYRVIEELAKAIGESVQHATERPTKNAFGNMNLRMAVMQLSGAIKRAYPDRK